MRLLLIALGLALSGCATIIKSDMQTVTLNGGLDDGTTKVSTPSGEFSLSGGQTVVSLARTRADIPIGVTCNGVTQKTVIKTRFDVAAGGLGNLIFGGIPGWFIDGVGDKAYDAPKMFNVAPYCSQEPQRATAAKH